MLVSWNWLKQYIELPMEPAELTERLAMAGLNHEATCPVDGDLAIDLEVTSNRPDWLSHLGVAREIGALWERPARFPEPKLPAGSGAPGVAIRVEDPELCPRYIGRVIRGVRIGPSPGWMADRLRAVGVKAINNVVDITNYVMLECGQPLHAFDLSRLGGQEIRIRRARADEPFVAIDHREYTLDPSMCVIADTRHPVALAGVMGGLDSEVVETTTDVLVESADFDPMAVRHASRTLRLSSPSSYRFERTVDPMGVDWASRRACQLILELAGGTLAEGPVEDGPRAGRNSWSGPQIPLRLGQIERILGIAVDRGRVAAILRSLGLELVEDTPETLVWVAPSWRRDLTREVDLVEEVARIHGYDQIPEDVSVPMAASQKGPFERVLEVVRRVMTATGFDEAMTPSVVDRQLTLPASPWTDTPPLVAQPSLLRGANLLRQSLIPSLLEARRANQGLANARIELFETAKVYWPQGAGLPQEPWMLGLTSGRSYADVKGVVEALLGQLGCTETLAAEPVEAAGGLFAPGRSARLTLGGHLLGFLGEVDGDVLRGIGVRGTAVAGEIRVDTLITSANLVRQAGRISEYPAVEYDLNFVVEEGLPWARLAETVAAAGGDLLEELTYRETYRDPQRDGPGTKRLLLSVRLRAPDRTLTSDESDQVRQQVIRACQRAHNARLLA